MRKEWNGAAARTTLAGSITDSATTISCTDLTGWPTGALYPFVVTLNRDQADEEKILVDHRSSNDLVDVTRGWDGTAAQAHGATCTVEHTIDADSITIFDRLAHLLGTVGSVYVYNGTNVVELVAGADDSYLVTDSGDPKGVKWMSRLIPIDTVDPAYLAGDRYFNSSRNELMVAAEGVWQSAALGVLVFATTTARDTLLGAAGPAGRLAYVTAGDGRLYLGTGTEWVPLPNASEFVLHFADTAERDAELPSPADGQYVWIDGTHTGYVYRNTEWVVNTIKVTVSSTAPADPQTGDIWLEPVS